MKLNSGREIELSLEEAKEVYQYLNQFFHSGLTYYPSPYIVYGTGTIKGNQMPCTTGTSINSPNVPYTS